MLADCSDLRAELKLKKVPHFTTLHKAHQRLLNIGLSTQLLDASVRLALGERPAAALVAGDSTGIDTSQISPYFITRRSHKQKPRKSPPTRIIRSWNCFVTAPRT